MTASGVVDTRQAQLGDQTILERAPEAFDASLGLRRAGGDRADAQIDQHPTELRRICGTRKLLLERPAIVRIALEDAVPIVIERIGDAVRREHVAEQEEVAMGILLRAEDRAHDGAGGIVDGRQQRAAWLVGPNQ